MFTFQNNESTNKIGSAILSSTETYYFKHKAKQRLDVYDKDYVYFLKNGSVSLYSCGSELLVMNALAPQIIGLEKTGSLNIISHLRCNTDVEMYIIKTSSVSKLLDELELWGDAYYISLAYLNSYHKRDSKLSKLSATEIIMEYIKDVWSLDVSQRHHTSLYTFILERTHISRSLIHRVISKLESDDLINVRKGILHACKLP